LAHIALSAPYAPRDLVGHHVTGLQMQGFSVTVCRLTDALTRLWDAPVDTPALRWGR
jgi:phosphoenolpyruvate---glycerone phosphotransferase subunit DhaK